MEQQLNPPGTERSQHVGVSNMQEQQGCILESGVDPALEDVDTSIAHSALPMDLPCMQQQQRTSSIRLHSFYSIFCINKEFHLNKSKIIKHTAFSYWRSQNE